MSTERTSGSIEAWNFILKQIDHHQKSRARPDLFLKNNFKVLQGRQITFVDNLHKKKQNKIKVKINS